MEHRVIAVLLAAATAAVPTDYKEVQQLDLGAALHTKTMWSMQVLQPLGDDAEIGHRPARICLTGGKAQVTRCQDIVADGYVFQTIDGAAIEPLSAKAGVKAVIVHAHFSGGAHALKRTLVFAYNGAGLADDVSQTAAFEHGDLGEERPLNTGPLDGLYVVANARIRGQETYWDDHRYSITAYRLTPYGGYDQVLQYVTAHPYPSEREAPGFVVDHELPRLKRLLASTYPKGLP
jgi:hypothetical protein